MIKAQKNGSFFSSLILSLVFYSLLIPALPTPAWPQCTSCQNCPPPFVDFTKQMSTGGNQPLTAIGGIGPYTWTKVSGEGTLSGSGASVTYTAPSSNVEDCTKNPTIQVTDSCNQTTVLEIGVNGYTSHDDYAVQVSCMECRCTHYSTSDNWACVGERYYCDGSPAQEVWTTLLICDMPWACGCEVYRQTWCPSWCNNEVPVITEHRSTEMKAVGCCPPQWSTCLNITGFDSDATTINLSSGQKANLTGSIFPKGGGTTNWSVIVERLLEEGGFQTVNSSGGSGNSVSKEWDGKNSSGKLVDAGNYRVSLAARNTGGTCGDDSDFKSTSSNINVKATAPFSACRFPDNYGQMPSTQGKCGSTVDFATGNLFHSQPLFTLPNSKFFSEFSLSYNSLSSQNDILGMGWTHTYNLRLGLNNDGSYTLTEGDGVKTVLYSKGSYFSPQNWNFPALTVNQNGTFTVQHKDGITYSFDSDKKITAISDRNSNTISFSYSTNSLTVADPNGRSVVISYVNGKINTISDPSGNVHTFSYSGENLTQVSSQIANVGTANWGYTYFANSFMESKTDPRNKTTWYTYYDDHKLHQTIDPETKTRTLVYNPAQSLTQMTEKDGGVWTYKYDANLGVLTEVDYPDSFGPKEKYGYFQSGVNTGKLEYVEDQRGKRTYYSYDSAGNGNIASITDALSHATSYPIYNSLNQVKRIEYPGTPAPVVLLDYNTQGNLTYFKDPEGNETQFGYDSRGNLTTIQSLGNTLVNITNTYDQYNYLRTITDNRTNAVIQLEYDSAGNLSLHKDPMTPTNNTAFEYNGFNKVKKVTDPESNIVNFVYDLMANMTSMTDANQKTTSYEYNYRGQVTKNTDALTYYTQFAYGSGCPTCGTGVEKLTSVTDARGKTTIFQYDLAGRLIKETDQLGKFKSYNYYIDASQNKITRTDEDNVTIQYFYDDLYRLTQISYPNTTAVNFAYDARGNMTSAANQYITHSPMAYDLNNRLTSITDSNGKTVSYQYNSLNQRTQMVADGRTINYSYDSGNRLYQVLSPNPVATITYDLAGRRQTLSYPNLITTTYTPNRAGFLTNLLTRYNQQTTINSFAYTPDGMGNRTNMTDLAGQHVYAYDDTYQLTQATHPNMPLEQFTYDTVGNRLSSQGQAPAAGRSTEYVYDFENRLIEVNYTGMLAQYKYDPFGRRIEKNVNGTITRYLYDGPNIATEYDNSWNIKAQYTHALEIDDPMTVTQGTNTFYYHRDGLGSVVNLTDASGNVAKTYTYKSFGGIYSETGSLAQPFTFTGREYDPENGLYFYRARYYDPKAGRFLTKDPIGFAGGDVNLYRSVRNNPVNFIDPFGLWSFAAQYYTPIGGGGFVLGRNSDGGFFWNIRYGWGWGGGFEYDPYGKSPGYDLCNKSKHTMTLGGFGEIGAGIGPLAFGYEGAGGLMINSPPADVGLFLDIGPKIQLGVEDLSWRNLLRFKYGVYGGAEVSFR